MKNSDARHLPLIRHVFPAAGSRFSRLALSSKPSRRCPLDSCVTPAGSWLVLAWACRRGHRCAKLVGLVSGIRTHRRGGEESWEGHSLVRCDCLGFGVFATRGGRDCSLVPRFLDPSSSASRAACRIAPQRRLPRVPLIQCVFALVVSFIRRSGTRNREGQLTLTRLL